MVFPAQKIIAHGREYVVFRYAVSFGLLRLFALRGIAVAFL